VRAATSPDRREVAPLRRALRAYASNASARAWWIFRSSCSFLELLSSNEICARLRAAFSHIWSTIPGIQGLQYRC